LTRIQFRRRRHLVSAHSHASLFFFFFFFFWVLVCLALSLGSLVSILAPSYFIIRTVVVDFLFIGRLSFVFLSLPMFGT
jgi:hypothetical protein